MKKRCDFLKFDLHDELEKIWRELEILRENLESIKRELILYKKPNIELQMIPSERNYEEAALQNSEKECNIYVDVVRDIDIVRKVLLIQTGMNMTIWTIIDDPPPENSPLKTVYDDKLNTLQILKHNVPFKMEILNVAQLRKRGEFQRANSKTVWQR